MEYIFNLCFFHNRFQFFSIVVLMILCLLTGTLCSASCHSDKEIIPELPSVDFTTFSLEELKNVEIISVSKKPEKISEAPAAVFVISQEDIRRSGATNIADALRLAPGVQVARMNTHGWAISVRGFNDFYSNKLLVLIDGRSVYTPIFSGVFWDVQDTLMEDIDRIEVIRGPGSALWGANAVNGVINIITKHAKDTQGGMVSGGNGTRENGFGSARYGGAFGKSAHYRIYAKYFGRDRLDSPAKTSMGKAEDDHLTVFHLTVLKEDMRTDSWQAVRGGFRLDWEPGPDTFTFQGEAYTSRDYSEMESLLGGTEDSDDDDFRETSRIDGVHVLGRWRHSFSDTSDSVLQIYHDHTERDSLEAKYAINTLDLDFQHRFNLIPRHEMTWGLGYRFIRDKIDNFYFISFSPDEWDQHLFSAFFQDEISIIEDQLSVTLGTKIEHNDFTGFEYQPSIRFLWMPRARHSFWGAVSRAVRVPSRAERSGVQIERLSPFETETNDSGTSGDTDAMNKWPKRGINLCTETGSDAFDSEKVTACELGYRLQPADTLWLDLALFYNDYEDLKVSEFKEEYLFPSDSDESILSGIIDGKDVDIIHWIHEYPVNKMEGETYGAEIAADWQAKSWWRIKATYSYLQMHMHLTGDATGTEEISEIEDSSPSHQFSLFSGMDITKHLDLDMWLRHVSDLPSNDVDTYTTLDIRLGWKPMKNLEISMVGQDLLDHRHAEFSQLEVERSAYFKVTWKF
ncbi:MAG: hypothetical protein B6245_05570 [Desulfobacteraceae bacterium 4572_88]|nr:MAG: hypothetical protein B6245_05570 [Desulfobacteraceae bacterium 4572_88]RLC13249.1 MAG: TonB-dependent receptor [Deltaproteobacteria bacterium]